MSKDSPDKKAKNLTNLGAWDLSRRDLIKIGALGLTALAGTNVPGISSAFATSTKEPEAPQGPSAGFAPKPNKTQYVLTIGKQELNPDGAQPTAAITANGALPAPEIRVKEGDLLRIQVENRLSKQDTSHSLAWLACAGRHGRRPARLPGAHSSGTRYSSTNIPFSKAEPIGIIPTLVFKSKWG